MLVRILLFFCAPAFLLGFTGCGNDGDISPSGDVQLDSLISAFQVENGIEFQEGPNGILYYPISQQPDSASAASRISTVYYRLEEFSPEGTVIIDNLDEDVDVPGIMKQGTNSIYPTGLDYGLSLMREGEEYGFILPPSQGWEGFDFRGIIDDSSYVHMIVKIAEVQTQNDVDGQQLSDINDFILANSLNDTLESPVEPVINLPSGSIFKRLTKDTVTAQPLPSNGDLLTLNYTVHIMSGPELEDTLTIGSVSQFELEYGVTEILPGLEEGLGFLRLGERAVIVIPSMAGYQESASWIPVNYNLEDHLFTARIIPEYALDVPPFSILLFDVRLVDIR